MAALLIGLVPALGWGLMATVMQLIGGTAIQKQMGMTLSVLVVAMGIALARPPAWSTALVAAAAINGIAWSFSEILLVRSFELAGVSTVSPFSTGLQLIGAALIGVAFLGEWRGPGQLVMGVSALALVVAGVALSSYRERGGHGASRRAGGMRESGLARGLAMAAASAVLSVTYASVAGVFGVDGLSLLLPQGVFMVLTTFAIGILLNLRARLRGTGGGPGHRASLADGIFVPKTWQNMITGVCFAAGNACVLVSNQMNGLAVGWTLSQMNVIVSTICGLVVLKECKTRRETVALVLGLALVAAGGVIIGMTRA